MNLVMLRLAVITDIHYGPDKKTRLGSHAPRLVDEFVRAVNRRAPHAVIELGDRVSSFSPTLDKAHMRDLRTQFNQMAAPLYCLPGNNDIRNLSIADNELIMGRSMQSQSVVMNGYRLLIWAPNVNTDTPEGLFIAPGDMGWLRRQLVQSREPVLLFTHVPLDNMEEDDRAALAYDGSANRSYYPEGPRVRRMLEESGKVVMCIAGHRHTSRYREINNIHYVIQQSLTQRLPDRNAPHEAWSMVEITRQGAVSVRGNGFNAPHYHFISPTARLDRK